VPCSEYYHAVNKVVPRNGHKGHIVKKILQDSQARNKVVDFVLCMGDDISDEKMFTVRPPGLFACFIFRPNLTRFLASIMFSLSSTLLHHPRTKILMRSTWQWERNQRMLRFTLMMPRTFVKY